MLSELQAKAGSYSNFRAMGFSDEKARAHADVSAEELASVLEEVERQKESPEERAAKKLNGRFEAIEARLAALEASTHTVDPVVDPHFNPNYSQPGHSQPKQRKKPNLSPEERQRRSDNMKRILADRKAKQAQSG